MLIIHRDNLLDTERAYKIIIDGSYYGNIKCGKIKQVNIGKGNHTIYLKIDWCRSNKVNFSILGDEIISFNCGNSMTGWRILLLPFYVTLFKNKYLFLKQN